jgi:putative Mn2+ efflux pump MntP
MRLASRIIAILLVLAGLSFLTLVVLLVFVSLNRGSVLAESNSHRTAWISGSILAVLGVGFILAGRYYLQFDVNVPDWHPKAASSRLTSYFLAHRREWKSLALLGLIISLVHLGAVSFGADWMGWRITWPLAVVWIGLFAIANQVANRQATQYFDWQMVPDAMRFVKAMLKAGQAAFLILALILVWNRWSHRRAPSQIVGAAMIVLLFAWELLFFSYGKIKSNQNAA